eukprot:365509-Chlamydomonas_euryale.AAC.3
MHRELRRELQQRADVTGARQLRTLQKDIGLGGRCGQRVVPPDQLTKCVLKARDVEVALRRGSGAAGSGRRRMVDTKYSRQAAAR